MKTLKSCFIFIVVVMLVLQSDIPVVKGAGDYVTVKNNSGASVDEGELIRFEGVSAYNQFTNVRLYYMIYDPNNALVSAYNFVNQYDSDTREIYYSHQFLVTRSVFAKRGLYRIRVMYEKSSGGFIDDAEFQVFVDITEKPKQPTFSTNPAFPTQASVVNVTINQGAGENPALLPLTLYYRQSIFEDWKTYTSPVAVNKNGSYVYAKACKTNSQCSKVATYFVNNVLEPTTVLPTPKTAPTVFKEESRIATYYYVGFKRSDSGTLTVPVPSGTTPP